MQKALSTIRIALPLCLLGTAGVVHAMPGEETGGPGVESSLPTDTTADRGASPADGSEAVAGFGKAVDDKGLDDVRGGFDLGDGLVASLGIQQVAYIDGNLVTSTSINIPNIGQITQQEALNLAAALGNLNLVVQNGPGNSIGTSSTVQNNAATTPVQGVSSSAVAPAATAKDNTSPTNAGVSSSDGAAALLAPGNGLATVIQNSLNNQSIRTLTTLNISVNTLQVMHDLNLQNTLQAAQMLSLGH
jgi:hypothetical protein